MAPERVRVERVHLAPRRPGATTSTPQGGATPKNGVPRDARTFAYIQTPWRTRRPSRGWLGTTARSTSPPVCAMTRRWGQNLGAIQYATGQGGARGTILPAARLLSRGGRLASVSVEASRERVGARGTRRRSGTQRRPGTTTWLSGRLRPGALGEC